MVPARILIVDDSAQILESLHLLLKDEFKEIDLLRTPKRIPEYLWRNTCDVIMLDMNFAAGDTSGNEGIFWMNEIRKSDPLLPIILITAYGDIGLAVRAIKEGATDFVTKPWDPDKLIITLQNAYRLRHSSMEVKRLKQRQQQLSDDLDRNYRMIEGSSESMRKVMEALNRVAATDANVLILGENGTGKELVAREIHKRSSRSDQIFVSVDMASLSGSLFESEMFGHVKGAFTDAREDRSGRFENADGGTLFLDEIGNIPISLQVKLLQVIQNRELTRVGDHRPRAFDIRLITATNQSLQQMIAEGSFREDLYYRLNTVSIELPPLRERQEDIEILGRHFLLQYSRKYGKTGLNISPRALERLRTYPWPGNIRELRHTVERVVIMANSKMIEPEDLQLSRGYGAGTAESYRLEDVERNTILKVLEKCRGNLTRAAGMLNISRTTLYAKMKKYGL